MLPYHLILILGITAVAVVPGALIFPFMIIPSYYLNIRQYFSIMIYWWKGNRFQENADAEKMRPEVKARLLQNKQKKVYQDEQDSIEKEPILDEID